MKIATLAAAALLSLATFATFAPAHAADDSTYQGLGGRQGIKNIVTTLVQLVEADPRIKASFAESDMKHVAMRLEQQFCMLSGGPCKYEGEPMKESHGGLKVTNLQFNALAEDLQVAMERHGVASSVQNKLVARLAPMQRDIVTE
jgi:hemoglobin